MAKLKPKNINYAVPGEPITKKEFLKMIKDAENGQFYSMETLKHKIEEWKMKFAK